MTGVVTAGRLLLLAGTTEARLLAQRLAAVDGGPQVVASLAGVTSEPARYPCPVRRGPFGGPASLASELRAGGYTALIDATHPFAASMPHEAATAADDAGVPRLRLVRPPWTAEPGDRWHTAPDLAGAAKLLLGLGARRPFLATGRQGLAAFASLPGVHLVVRSVEAPDLAGTDAAGGAGVTVILARGPFDIAAERELLLAHAVDVVVTKNSGGTATAAKLAAARDLGLAVVMVDRPPVPPGPLATTVDQALAWALETVPAP